MSTETILPASTPTVTQALQDLALKISQSVPQQEMIGFVGIHTRGVPLAKRLASEVSLLQPARQVQFGSLDVSFHRDDLNRMIRPPHLTDIGFEVENCWIILVDDVLFTGRTIRAALNAITDLGRPRTVQLAVVVDRGHRQLPICADYTGITVSTSPQDRVQVHVQEIDGKEDICITKNL